MAAINEKQSQVWILIPLSHIRIEISKTVISQNDAFLI